MRKFIIVLSILCVLTSALFFTFLPTGSHASAHPVSFMHTTIEMKHNIPVFRPQPADYFCTANKPCLDIRNNTNRLQIVRYLYTDPTHFRQLNLKPKEIFHFIPKEVNWHYVFRIIWKGQVGDEMDVQTF